MHLINAFPSLYIDPSTENRSLLTPLKVFGLRGLITASKQSLAEH